ncbi:hypothetical protein LCGC14_1282620 [marine sediment metagenome]|uniref:Uncharacterized protein n=1 Tax=marine sediment metagenome TaxID=412755 RepID=A0A0F9KWH8_9ZZZZ
MATAKKKKTAKRSTRRKAPKPPTPEELDVTDPRRKLSKEERQSLTPEQKKARRQAARDARGPAKVQIGAQLAKLETRLGKIVARLADSDASEAGETFIKALRVLRSDVAELSDDWKPSRARGPVTSRFVEKQKVVLKEKKRAQYEGLLDGEFEFTVKKVVKRQVLCWNKKTGKLVFRQSDLELATA